MSRTRAAKPEAGSASARRRRWNTAWQNEVARVVSRWPGCADGFWAYGDAGGGARPMALSSQVGREHAAHPDRRAEVQAAVVAAAAASQRGVAARVASAAARAGGGCCGGWFVVVVVVVVVGGVGGGGCVVCVVRVVCVGSVVWSVWFGCVVSVCVCVGGCGGPEGGPGPVHSFMIASHAVGVLEGPAALGSSEGGGHGRPLPGSGVVPMDEDSETTSSMKRCRRSA